GANIIDQYDANHEPTVIQFAKEEFYGIEDLPAINKMAHRPANVNQPNPTFYNYILPELWNNHRKLLNVNTTDYPSIRVRALNGGYYGEGYVDNPGAFYAYLPGTAPFSTTPATLSMGTLETYREPRLIRNASGLGLPVAPVLPPADIQGAAGYRFDYTGFPVGVNAGNYHGILMYYSNVVMVCEYQNSKGNWMPYSTFAGVANGSGVSTSSLVNRNGIHPVSAGVTTSGNSYLFACAYQTINELLFFQGILKSDPCTTRFGVSLGTYQVAKFSYKDLSLRPNILTGSMADTVLGYSVGYPVNGTKIQPWANEPSQYFGTGQSSSYIASMAENRYRYTAAIPCTYPDLDGIQRWGDYGLDENPYTTTQKINPYKSNTDTYRPIILDRAFRSSGELGYVYRDMPWKTLDYFTTNSADMVLQDLFDSHEHPSVVAGKLSWNVPYPEIWKTLLIGGDRAYQANNTQAISSDDAAAISTKIYQSYAGKESVPVSRSDFIRSIATTQVSTTWPAFKHHREAVLRQVSEVGQSSTINLMMDLVIEDGKLMKIPGNTKTFSVQGRKRYWVSFALDRLTYSVIDLKIEEVL
ncbi:MAG: hypothetical protein V4507_13910, partial [Verrucomicrobiota bacterium]